jgi:hypothetical protein
MRKRLIGVAVCLLASCLLSLIEVMPVQAQSPSCDTTPHFVFPEKAYTFTTGKLSPNYPLIIQQDPKSRGVDLQVSLKLEPGTVNYKEVVSVPKTIEAGWYYSTCADLGVSNGTPGADYPSCYVPEDTTVYEESCVDRSAPVTRGIQNITIFLVPTMKTKDWLLYSEYSSNPVINGLYPADWWDAFIRDGFILPCEMAGSTPCTREGNRFLFASPASSANGLLEWPTHMLTVVNKNETDQPYYRETNPATGSWADYLTIVLVFENNAGLSAQTATQTAGAGEARPQYVEWTLSAIQIDFPGDFFIAAHAYILPAEWRGVLETLPATIDDPEDNCGVGMTPACNQPNWDGDGDFSVAMIFSTLCSDELDSCGKGLEGQ